MLFGHLSAAESRTCGSVEVFEKRERNPAAPSVGGAVSLLSRTLFSLPVICVVTFFFLSFFLTSSVVTHLFPVPTHLCGPLLCLCLELPTLRVSVAFTDPQIVSRRHFWFVFFLHPIFLVVTITFYPQIFLLTCGEMCSSSSVGLFVILTRVFTRSVGGLMHLRPPPS